MNQAASLVHFAHGADEWYSFTDNSMADDPEMSRDKSLIAAAKKLSKEMFLDGYGQLYFKSETGEVWFETSDSNTEEECREIEKRLKSLDMVHGVRLEAETGPPKDEGWERLWPSRMRWVKNSNPEGINQYSSGGSGKPLRPNYAGTKSKAERDKIKAEFEAGQKTRWTGGHRSIWGERHRCGIF